MKKFIFILIILFFCILTWFSISFFSQSSVVGMSHIGKPDSTFFFRLNEQSILQNRIIESDYFQCFPYKVKLNFPPLPRVLLYHWTLLMYYFFPEISLAKAVGFLPIIFGFITTILIIMCCYYITKNKAITLLVAFFSIPGFFSSHTHTYLMVDHHYLVNMFIWLWIIFARLTIEKPDNSYFRIAGSLAATCLLLTWVGSPLFIGITTALGIIYWVFSINMWREYLDYLADSWLIGGILLGLVLYITNQSSNFSVAYFGWFHALAPIIISLSVRFIIFFAQHRKGILIISAISIIILIIFKAPFINEGLSLTMNKDYIFKTIGELRPIASFIFNPTNKNVKIFDLVNFFGPMFLLLPFALIWPAKGVLTGKSTIIRDMFIIIVLLAFNQFRYSRWLASSIGLLSGIAVFQLFHLFYKQFKGQKYFKIKSLIAFTPFFVVCLNTNFISLNKSPFLKEADVNAYAWIRSNTPDPAGYTDGKKPAYGILSHWDKGNEISYYTHRPAVVSNTLLGFKTMSEIFTSRTEAEAVKYCNKYQVKYLLLSRRQHFSNRYLAYLDSIKIQFKGPHFSFISNEWERNITSSDVRTTLYFWLTYFVGIKPAGNFTSSSHFRLRWAYQENKLESPIRSIFEVVKGCKIKGTYKPNEKIFFKLKIKFNELSFIYSPSTTCDQEGKFSATLCYPTKNISGEVITSASYEIVNNEKKIGTLEISPKNIEKGTTRFININVD